MPETKWKSAISTTVITHISIFKVDLITCWFAQKVISGSATKRLPLDINIKTLTSALASLFYRIRFSNKTRFMWVKTVFLCDVLIRRNLWLKLQKIDKSDSTFRKKPKLRILAVSKLQKLFKAKWDIAQKNGFHDHNLVLCIIWYCKYR